MSKQLQLMALLLNLGKRNSDIFPNHGSILRVCVCVCFQKSKKCFNYFRFTVFSTSSIYIRKKETYSFIHQPLIQSENKGAKNFITQILLVLYLNHNCHLMKELMVKSRQNQKKKSQTFTQNLSYHLEIHFTSHIRYHLSTFLFPIISPSSYNPGLFIFFLLFFF